MSYRNRLKVWAVVRLLPRMQRAIVARYKSESDALGHVETLRRLQPDAHYRIIFDVPLEQPEPKPQPKSGQPQQRYVARSLYRSYH
ncbi:hypothetical protein HC928_12530 [bacterium]|nr:hypothetical protein [bacterium]